MEIIKQLFDVASLFDITDNLDIVSETFHKFATTELKYRNLDWTNTKQVLDDIYHTALCICLRGQENSGKFNLLNPGIKRIQSFIHSERYTIDSAITNASKAAYLSVLIANNMKDIQHFDSTDIESLRNAIIQEPLPTKLNKLKKTNIEAFFYWHEIGKINVH